MHAKSTTTTRKGLIKMVGLLGLALISARCPAQDNSLITKSDSFLSQRMALPPTTGWTSVIVRMDGDLTPAKKAQLKALRADIYRHLPIIHALALHLPGKNLAGLAALPFVTHLSADLAVKKCDEFTVGSSEANVAWQQYGLNGSGVTVAVVDSGVSNLNPDFFNLSNGSSRILSGVSFVPNQATANDTCGHGTHVAGILGGNGLASRGFLFFRSFYGIAPKVNLVNVRVLDSQGQGSVSTVVSGIQWVVNNAAAYHIRVLNLSLSHPIGESYTTDPLCQACESAWKAGIFVVCAAGNQGRMNTVQSPDQPNEGWGAAYGSIQSPGNDPYVITVGAMKNMDGNRAHDQIATYSGRGPTRLDLILKPDIVAPGNQIISTDAPGSNLNSAYSGTNLIPWQSYCRIPLSGNSCLYFKLSGTSMAAPVVAGAAALMLQANPSLSPDAIKARLMISADKWSDPSGNFDPCTYGAGYLNIAAALANTTIATSPVTSPPLMQDDSGNVRITNIIWGTNGANGANIIWGVNNLTLNTIWGNNILWGSNILWGNNILWGAGVWSDNIVWGVNTSTVDLSSTAIYGE